MSDRPSILQFEAEVVSSLAETKTWAIRPELLAGMARLDAAGLLTPPAAQNNGSSSGNGVSIVGLKGVITPAPSLLAMLFGGGGGGLVGFLSDLRAAVADPETRAVVLDVDSPGGLVDLVPEAAAQMRAIRDAGSKPIVAVANTQAASAAYWLASQANEIVVTPSGDLGSIGVYTLHRDMSEAFAMRGVKHTLISAGKYKVEGNPYEPLDDEAFTAEQLAVNDYYDMFVADVAAGRQVDVEAVRDGYGEGRSLTAHRAVRAGLADKVATLDETVARMASGRARVKRQPEMAEDPSAVVYTKEQRLRLLDALVPSR